MYVLISYNRHQMQCKISMYILFSVQGTYQWINNFNHSKVVSFVHTNTLHGGGILPQKEKQQKEIRHDFASLASSSRNSDVNKHIL